MKVIPSVLFAGSVLLTGDVMGVSAPAEAPFAQNIQNPSLMTAKYEIRLRSRSFIPPPNVEAFLMSDRRYGVIQFFELPDNARHQSIAETGIILHDSIPNFAYTASIGPSISVEQLEALGVRALFAFEREDKLFQALLNSDAGRKRDVIVAYYPDAPTGNSLALNLSALRLSHLSAEYHQDEPCKGEFKPKRQRLREKIKSLLQKLRDRRERLRARVQDLRIRLLIRSTGAKIISSSTAFQEVWVRVDSTKVGAIADFDWVRWIEPTPRPPVFFNNISRAAINVGPLQEKTFFLSGQGVKLGIWDEGKVFEHQDFNDRLTIVESRDVSEHATHVAGTMAGDGKGSDGLYRGMAPGAEVFSWTVDGEGQQGHGQEHVEMLNGIKTQKIAVSQNSWGAIAFCDELGVYTAQARYFDQLAAFENLHVAFAAGNLREFKVIQNYNGCVGYPFRTIPPPASGKNMITVGGVEKDGQTMSEYSSWGPVKDDRLKPDVVAVGGTLRGLDRVDGVTSTFPDNGYDNETQCGTSMATPAISGTLALLIERYRQEPYVIDNTATPTPALLKAILLNTATDLGNPGPDYQFGYGMVNARAAVGALDRAAFRTGGISQERPRAHVVTVERTPNVSCSIKVLLTWSDTPAAQNAAPALVNDLDLRLVAPNGDSYVPLTLDPDAPNVDAVPAVNRLDNVEQVVVDDAASGAWTISITGMIPDPRGQRYVVTWLGNGCTITGEDQA
jgi:hypothetical protein